jgi:hypothetical protein
MEVTMMDQAGAQPTQVRTNWRSKFFEIVGLPLIGVVLAAIFQASFPEIWEKAKLRIVGIPFGPYVMLMANDSDANDPPVSESLTLTEYYGRLSGELHIPPDGTRNIPPEGVRRLYSGFLGGDGFLVLAYKSDPPLHGIGEYFLAENDDGNYTGHARVNICTPRGQIIKQCNAIFTKNEGYARKQYAGALKQQCQLVVFPSPDENGKVAEKEACPESFQTGQR